MSGGPSRCNRWLTTAPSTCSTAFGFRWCYYELKDRLAARSGFLRANDARMSPATSPTPATKMRTPSETSTGVRREPPAGERPGVLGVVAPACQDACQLKSMHLPSVIELARMAPDQRRRPSRPRGFRCPARGTMWRLRGSPCKSREVISSYVCVFSAARLTNRFRRASAFAPCRFVNAARGCLIAHLIASRSSCRRPSSLWSRSPNARRGCLITDLLAIGSDETP